MIMTFKNQPFAATWTENSAGRTSTYSSIFRKQVVSPQGVPAPLAAKDREKHHWVVSLPKEELGKILGLSKIVTITPYLDHQSEKTYALRVSDGIKTQDLDFFALQQKIGASRLRSNDFEVEIKGDKVIFNGFGQGHGVGLCLYSARLMSQKGDGMAKILSYFFPNTQLQKMTTAQLAQNSEPSSK
jgi:stage II sporulation protein D